MNWSYTAFDKAGKSASGTIEAVTTDEAKDLLRKRGLFVSKLSQAGGAGKAGPARSGRRMFSGKTRRMKDLSQFMRQLAVLVSTGTPLVEAIEVLERQLPSGRWHNTVQDVRTRVEEGSTLSAAMEHHTEYFDAICRSLVAAGESSGRLGELLQRLASMTRQQLKVRTAVVGAMVYPCVLIFVAMGVMGMMMGFVLPRFEGLFQSLGAPLPPLTKALMGISAWGRGNWYFLLAGAIAAGVGAKFYLGSAAGKRAIDLTMVRAPQIGKVTRAFATARIARVLGVLVEGKVALLDALKLTRQSTDNFLYVELMERAEAAVTRGEPVSAALMGSNLINASVVEAMRSGERSGQVAPVLLNVADFLDEDNEVVVKTITSILEPLILVILGLVVGGVALSMFLPLFDLTASASNPGGPQ